MTAPADVRDLCSQYILKNVVPLLPREVGAVSVETVAWLITVHTYQHAVFSGTGADELDACVDRLADSLPAREGEPWQSTLASHRREAGKPIQYEGEVVYECWGRL